MYLLQLGGGNDALEPMGTSPTDYVHSEVKSTKTPYLVQAEVLGGELPDLILIEARHIHTPGHKHGRLTLRNVFEGALYHDNP